MSKNKIIALDFDGTCVMHEYPRVGDDVPNAVEVLKKLNANEVKIILWTMRSGEYLQDAVNWFAEREIEIWAVNENPQQKHWTQSPKAYAPVYIDDAALGCPLKFYDDGNGSRPFADWVEIERLLEEIGFLDSSNSLPENAENLIK
jgi:hypothetical protein